MSLQYIKGVGPKRIKKLNRLNIYTIKDLLYYIPRQYEDRSIFKKINETIDGEKTSIKIEICGYPVKSRPRKNLSMIKIQGRDETGLINITWFNQDYISNKLIFGESYLINGKIKRSGNNVQIVNPVLRESIGDSIGNIMPIYPLTSNLTNNEMIKIVKNALIESQNKLEEVLPKHIIEKLKLMSIKEAIYNIHFPKSRDSFVKARNRLVFEELLTLQLGLLAIKNKMSNSIGIKFSKTPEIDQLIDDLPFKLTSAQTRVFREIQEDMESSKQMNRLIQGDVGSGKTILAILAMFIAYKSGYQSVMMAPTEILANQHFENIVEMLEKHGLRCQLLVGSLNKSKKDMVLSDLKEGKIDILIGTHAIIQEKVHFNNLGLVITDEQHRFGVKQRANLSGKGINPDTLVMTATPIPRTLALILYGDLDISIIDELPPGRKKVETFPINSQMLGRMYGFLRKQVEEGRQAYIVCPLINESEILDLKAAEDLYIDLKSNIFRDLSVGLLHGKMKNSEKDKIMSDFKSKKIDILVSTSVIEVGVNVPNASIMVIYNAERFGLAQLHQLRGRVGRGEYKSYCILVNDNNKDLSRQRMKILQKTNDGFLISEKDMELRGSGEIFGTKQHGVPDLKIANLFTDIEILKLAQRISFEIIRDDPNLIKVYNRNLKKNVIDLFQDRVDELIFN